MFETRPSPSERRRLADHAATVLAGHVTVMVDRDHIFVAAPPAVARSILTVYTDDRLTPIAVRTNRHPLDTDSTVHLTPLNGLAAQIAVNRLNTVCPRPTRGAPWAVPTVLNELNGIDAAIRDETAEAQAAAEQITEDIDLATVYRIFDPGPWHGTPDLPADIAADRGFRDSHEYRRHIEARDKSVRRAKDVTSVVLVELEDRNK